jgi:multidrug efflux pump subunit AcrA (membrane-fusion protein)
MKTFFAKLKTFYDIKLKRFLPWIIGGCIALALAIAIYKLKNLLMTRQAELAKLRTAAEQAKIKAMAQTYQADLEANEAKRVQIKTEALVANNKATKALEAIHTEEDANKKELARLDAIKSWDDLDSINKAGR